MFSVRLRQPTPEDGAALHNLVERCPPLDTNSRYCNLLQVSHFQDTAIVAEQGEQLAGFVSGYRRPDRQDTLFVWQVGVAPEGRGRGLAPKMLLALLGRLPGIRYLETTVTPANAASAAVFEKVAGQLDASMERSVLFESDRHFEGAHDDEVLFRIGPFSTGTALRQTYRASAEG